MPLLHMQTEEVRGAGQLIQQTAVTLQDRAQDLSTAVNTLTAQWQGPSSNQFRSQIDLLLQQLIRVSKNGSELNVRIQREVDQWEQIDNSIGSTGANINQQEIPPDFVSNTQPTTPGLVEAILEDEASRRDISDDLGDLGALFIYKHEGKLESFERKMLEKISEPIEKISLGRAQMNPEVVIDMVDKGYLPKPEGWEEDQLDLSIKWLLDDDKASELVSARINQISDHWAAQGVDISDKPEIIGTLYSIGLDNNGVHPNPEANDRGRSIAERANEINQSQL